MLHMEELSMNRASLIFVIVAALTIALSGSALGQATNSKAIGGKDWTARMGWRYVSYAENDSTVALSIEPMVKGDDRVFVPDEAHWLKGAPAWARERRAEILNRLKSVAWNRKLAWRECECPLGTDKIIPGSVESTRGGQWLEGKRLFEPGSPYTHEEVHEIWHEVIRRTIRQATGKVTIFMSEVIPDSVFQVVELPTLKENPNVTIVFK